MAKLKILDGNGKPIPQAYINVVTNLFASDASYDGFVALSPGDRADKLQTFTDNAAWKITQLKKNANGNLTDQIISKSNCRILGEKDQKATGRAKSKVTMPLPDERPLDFGYLQDYAAVIHDFYSQADAAASPATKAQLRDKAHRFLFGAMLLTRCR